MRLILETGADQYQKDYESFNTLHNAATYQDNKEVIECLIAAGVNLHERNIWGIMPLAYTVFTNQAISTLDLLDFGADIDSKNNDDDTPLYESLHLNVDNVLQLLLIRRANYMLLYSSGGSVLYLVAKSGRLRTLEIL